MKMGKVIKVFVIVITVIAILVILFGCTQADVVANNISKEADAFNVQRKITVLNARTDNVMMELIGTFSLKNNNSHELEVICEVGPGVYKKHFIYLSEYTLYVVEDISGSNYEVNGWIPGCPKFKTGECWKRFDKLGLKMH